MEALVVNERGVRRGSRRLIVVVAHAVDQEQIRADLPAILYKKIVEIRFIGGAGIAQDGGEARIAKTGLGDAGERARGAILGGKIGGNSRESVLAINGAGLVVVILLPPEAGF